MARLDPSVRPARMAPPTIPLGRKLPDAAKPADQDN
jgi:hypothetical protein